MKSNSITYDNPFLSMTNFWLSVFSHLEKLPLEDQSQITLDVYTPILPWEYLLRLPELYRYYQSGIPKFLTPLRQHFPSIAVQECNILYQYYQATVARLYKVRYIFTMDMMANICHSINQLYQYNVIDEQERRSLLHQLNKILDTLEIHCTDFNHYLEFDMHCVPTFTPIEVLPSPNEFAAIDPTGAVVMAGSHFTDNYSQDYLSVIRNSNKINYSNPIERQHFFMCQRQVLKEHQA